LKISAAKASAAAIAVTLGALALGVPAIGQDRDQDAPESLLPPGFGDPVEQAPTPPPPAPGQPRPGQPTPLLPPITGQTEEEEELSEAEAEAAAKALAEALRKAELPAFARRSIAQVGVIDADGQGIEADAYGRAYGGFLSKVMRETDAPIASRWLSIALRRGLMSRTNTPAGVNGADFAAERAWGRPPRRRRSSRRSIPTITPPSCSRLRCRRRWPRVIPPRCARWPSRRPR
jgi:hypothetical protein